MTPGSLDLLQSLDNTMYRASMAAVYPATQGNNEVISTGVECQVHPLLSRVDYNTGLLP